ARHAEIDLTDEPAIAALARNARLDLGARVVIDGHDVTDEIRTSVMDEAAAIVARHPGVRAALVERQRGFAREGGLVMEGRALGPVVFPHADLKFYLDASPAERARRRALDPAHAIGRDATAVASVAQALEARDHGDRTRAASPLTRADDAIYLDTTGHPIDDVVALAMSYVEAALRAAKREN